MATDFGFRISDELIADHNRSVETACAADYDALGMQLERRGIAIDTVIDAVREFTVDLPSWAVGTGGTRFGRFSGAGEPCTLRDKLVDVATVQQLTRATPRVSLHIPWDTPDDPAALVEEARALGIGFGPVNSNTFQDQPGQPLSYKFGSLAHPDPAIRAQAVAHNLDCVAIGGAIGADALSIWIGDGGNYPGQMHFRRSLDRVTESLAAIYGGMPDAWRLLIEHKPYEPAFYSTVIQDWGTSYLLAGRIGKRVRCLVDLGHHLPDTNIEMVVARLIDVGRLAGFHFNDSKYGDDDLTSGSINPYQLFLVFNELVDAARDPAVTDFDPVYMIDQSHNVKDPLEAMIQTVEELQRACARALLVDHAALAGHENAAAVMDAERLLQQAFNTDVGPILAMARARGGGAIDPLAVFRITDYRNRKAAERDQPIP